MTALKDGLPTLPDRLSHLPIDARGYPVPWFVEWIDGVPDFRIMDGRKLVRAVEENRCWTCGEVNGAHKVFAIGPMCAVNRVTAEPPSHLECAEYAAKACPFLTEPKRRRRESDLPAERVVAGEMIARNPGVTLLWSTKSFRPFEAGKGVLFRLGEPTRVAWWCRGRTATHAEVVAALESGMPILREAARAGGDADVALLEGCYRAAQKYLPAQLSTPSGATEAG